MKKIVSFLLFFVFFLLLAKAQTLTPTKKYYSENKQHKVYFYWGYNRCAFLKSDIHFIGPDHDFTLHKVKAKERPTPFSVKGYFALKNLSIPQYNYRIGYYFTSNLGISVGLDHMKYVVTKQQTLQISGRIDEKASPKYAGIYDHKEMELNTDFLVLEHTDGLNLLSVDVEKLYPMRAFAKNRLRLNGQIGGGGGIVIPRTDARLFERGANNPFHLAGWGTNVKAGLKLDILKHFFLQTEIRTGFIRLNDILILHTESQRAKQNIFFGEWYMLGGWYF